MGATANDAAGTKKGTYKITGKQIFAGQDSTGKAAAAKNGPKLSTVNNGTHEVTDTVSGLAVNKTYYLYAVVSNGAPTYPVFSAVSAMKNNTGFPVTPADKPKPKPSNGKILSGVAAFFAIFLAAIMNF